MERAGYGYWKRKKQILAKHRIKCLCTSMQFTVSKEEGTNLVEKEENVKKADSNKTQPEENNTFDGKVMVTVIRIFQQ